MGMQNIPIKELIYAALSRKGAQFRYSGILCSSPWNALLYQEVSLLRSHEMHWLPKYVVEEDEVAREFYLGL